MKTFIKYSVTALIGGAAAFGAMCLMGVFGGGNAADIYKIISDGFLIPGVILLGVGLLCLASKGGLFDMLGYAVTLLFGALRRDVSKRKYKDYYEYRMAKKEKHGSFAYLIIVGIAYIALSALFIIFWHAAV